ncbi:ketopantoate hydroxymethyltransferase [Paenibacillus woosongensis]|uniref:Ketopantoate hydroxymethyltransferase n=1 Tax=Paenibacillus woosongensis TaxID=307580 RepID=A0A7X2YYQ2_9BACL|nr:ketopantoate hydroxymethyltransferase [Paenibacillus woosongensis]MUG44268.1 ketopantoate hydroxymethyltransferase [Paenibacillus woosongensis]
MVSSFLNDVARFVDANISKVVLNDTVEITSFNVKEVTGSTVGMQYIVPATDVSLVTKIELKDANNNIKTTNNVYVPITTDTLLLHTVQVKEV